MTQSHAMYVAQKISNQELFDMLQLAKIHIRDWHKPSKANAMFSRGKFWNMFHCGSFDLQKSHHEIYKFRLIQEFGEYLPVKYQPMPRKKARPDKVFHEDPIFDL